MINKSEKLIRLHDLVVEEFVIKYKKLFKGIVW